MHQTCSPTLLYNVIATNIIEQYRVLKRKKLMYSIVSQVLSLLCEEKTTIFKNLKIQYICITKLHSFVIIILSDNYITNPRIYYLVKTIVTHLSYM